MSTEVKLGRHTGLEKTDIYRRLENDSMNYGWNMLQRPNNIQHDNQLKPSVTVQYPSFSSI